MLLILTALIWGSAFVAQSIGMEYIGPFTFGAVRSILGGLTLLPVIFFRKKKSQANKGKAEPDEKKEKNEYLSDDRKYGTADRTAIYHSRKRRIYYSSLYSDCSTFGTGIREKSREKSLVRCYFGCGWNVFPLRKRRIFYFKGRLDHFGRFFRFCGTHSCDRLFFAESGWSMSFVSSVFYLQ